MSALGQSRSFADLLGAPLQALNAGQVADWIVDGLRESERLDFKAELYGNGESQRRELAGDLAAFANHLGGLLILGVAEDESGAASSVPGVSLSDDERRRIHQIVAGNVFPHLPIEIFAVELDRQETGVLVVAVAESPLRPHAVAINEGLRYPRRHGTVTRYLSESEVADLYRNRFGEQRRDASRVREIRSEAALEINEDGAVWIAVSAVPSGRGSLEISEQSISGVQQWAQRFVGDDRVSGFLGRAVPVVRPGLRRLRLLTHYAANSKPDTQYAELHADGSAVAMLRLFTGRDAPAAEQPLPVINLSLVWAVASALNVVASHAANVGAWGDASVELTVFGPPRFLAWIAQGHFVEPIEGARVLDGDLASRHTILLSEIMSGTQPLLAVTRLVLTDLFNAFGAPEVRAVASDGALVTRYTGAHQELAAWAQEHHVDVR